MRTRLLATALLLAALVGQVPGCAWANRDNRPAWNAFERHAVPEDDTWFVVLLPFTVPAGFVAILLDTFLLHPAQVIDDAAGDARDLWRGQDWEQEYYTELATLPLRLVGTPLTFAGAFLWRSAFDVAPYEPPLTEAEQRAREAESQARDERHWSAWFDSLARGIDSPPPGVPVPPWSPDLERAFQEARRRSPSTERATLYAVAREVLLPPLQAEPWMGLEDQDPVVRYLVLVALPADVEVPDELKSALLRDSNEAVRRHAQRRWP